VRRTSPRRRTRNQYPPILSAATAALPVAVRVLNVWIRARSGAPCNVDGCDDRRGFGSFIPTQATRTTHDVSNPTLPSLSTPPAPSAVSASIGWL
jgi:hypothetical protein